MPKRNALTSDLLPSLDRQVSALGLYALDTGSMQQGMWSLHEALRPKEHSCSFFVFCRIWSIVKGSHDICAVN